MTEIHDQHLSDLLVRWELEAMRLLHREVSAYLEFWHIAEEAVAADMHESDGRTPALRR